LDMRTQFRFKTLIELFNKSIEAVEDPDKVCLEVTRRLPSAD